MSRHRLFISILAAALLALALFAWIRDGGEPAYQGKPIIAWAQALNSARVEERNQAREVFRNLGRSAVPVLADALAARDSSWRKLLFNTARGLPKKAQRWLMERVRHPDATSRRAAAARALQVLGPEGVAAIPALRHALVDPEPVVANEAAAAFIAMGQTAVPVLLSTLTNATPDVRQRAYYALSSMGPAAESAIPTLLEQIHADNTNESHRAAFTLGRIGKPAVPALLDLSRHQAEQIRRLSIYGLGVAGIDARQTLPSLLQQLPSEVPSVRKQIIQAIGSIWPSNRQFVTNLVECLRDPDAEVRLAALQGLSKVPQAAAVADAVPKIAQILSEDLTSVRCHAATLLGLIGPAARPAIPVLTNALRDPNPAIQSNAREALARIDPSLVLTNSPKR